MQKYGTINDNEKGRLGVRGYHTGGRVQGFGTGDIVPAFLEPGEFVVKKDVAKQYEPELQRLNEGGDYGRVDEIRNEDITRITDNERGRTFRDNIWMQPRFDQIPRYSRGATGKQPEANNTSKKISEDMFRQPGGLMYAFDGRLVRNVSDDELAHIFKQGLANDLRPELPDLLTKPYIDTARKYNAPVAMFRDMKTVISPSEVMGGRAHEVPERWLAKAGQGNKL